VEIPRKHIGEMVGEAFREVAILVLVFAPLDRWVERRPYSLSDSWKTFGLGVTLFAIGVVVERVRPE
jgi:hypothetical protein